MQTLQPTVRAGYPFGAQGHWKGLEGESSKGPINFRLVEQMFHSILGFIPLSLDEWFQPLFDRLNLSAGHFSLTTLAASFPGLSPGLG